jgi:hypothetical protein
MIKDSYKDLLSGLAIPSVSLGYVGVHLHDVSELLEAQIGYSVDPSGISLIDENPGSWQTNWVVIGYETRCGDPIFIDTQAEGFPVYTAMHGCGTWEAKPVATRLRKFAMAMTQFARLAEGRSNPVQLEANPIEPNERSSFLQEILRENLGMEITFWEDWLLSE